MMFVLLLVSHNVIFLWVHLDDISNVSLLECGLFSETGIVRSPTNKSNTRGRKEGIRSDTDTNAGMVSIFYLSCWIFSLIGPRSSVSLQSLEMLLYSFLECIYPAMIMFVPLI